jgi:hypothetical protein
MFKVVEADTYEENVTKLKTGEFYTPVINNTKDEDIRATYQVEVINNKVIVTTPDGKVGEARCAPEDVFNLGEGVKVAMERINEKYHKLSTTEKLLLNTLKSLNAVYIVSHGDSILSFRDDNKSMLGIMSLPTQLFG